MLVFDHGMLRKLWRNEHEVEGGVWRSSQPDPGMVRRLGGRGFKAILNLRGATEYGSQISWSGRRAGRRGSSSSISRLTSRALPSRGGDPGA